MSYLQPKPELQDAIIIMLYPSGSYLLNIAGTAPLLKKLKALFSFPELRRPHELTGEAGVAVLLA